MLVEFLRVLSLILRDVAAVVDDASELAANDPPTEDEDYVEVPVGDGREGEEHGEGDGASMVQTETKRRKLQRASGASDTSSRPWRRSLPNRPWNAVQPRRGDLRGHG